jgi:hypothetical protein
VTGKSKENAPHWRGSFLSATTGSEACETREATTHARVLRSEQESRTPGRASSSSSSSSQLPCRTRTRPLLKIERWFTGAPPENARFRHLGRRRPSGVALARRFACPADENQARTGIVKRAPLYGWSVNLFFPSAFSPLRRSPTLCLDPEPRVQLANFFASSATGPSPSRDGLARGPCGERIGTHVAHRPLRRVP